MPLVLSKNGPGALALSRGSSVIPDTRTLINPSTDMVWKGMVRIPASGTADAGGPGTPSISSTPIAIRYVGGERRLITVLFQQAGAGTIREFADLVEYAFPPSGSYYTGPTPSSASALVETRRWAADEWQMSDGDPNFASGSAIRIGGLWWDEAQGVLWYQIYGYYHGNNMPFLGATQLLDTVTTGSYRAVGTRYGPWWYRTSTYPGGEANAYWKSVCNHIVPIPDYAQADMGGRKVMFGATTGAVGGAGHIGPGLHAFSDFPPLTDPAYTVIPLGFRVADFTNESPLPRSNCRRDTDYRNVITDGGGGFDPSGGVGFWYMTTDQVNTSVWVHTATKHGIVMFGRRVTGPVWYGYNPLPAASSEDGLEYTDPTRLLPDSLGYGAQEWHGAIRVYDPQHVREVGLGTRSPYADGMRPVEPVTDWKELWPNIPVSFHTSRVSTRMTPSLISQSAFWDAVAAELIWIQSCSVGNYLPTIQVFSISG